MDADLYCAEQISIPPTFPYLLRQYAKAAIRTQPVDLLKWSTTYFRCLSLNCPPPVKTRLEYPIPEDWNGLTPGWVKSLYRQMHPTTTVEFKLLWDRWIGSCLEHAQLIQMLCLGDFKDQTSISWLKLIGLCAGIMSNSLTHTMILVCEILTDEPDGASASITVEHFLEIYKFLANIDASDEQWLTNKHFTDSVIELWQEKKEKYHAAKKIEEVEEEGEICSDHEICETVEGKVTAQVEIPKEVSCPSIKEDDYQKIEDYLETQEKTSEAREEEAATVEPESEEQHGNTLRLIKKKVQQIELAESTVAENETDAGENTQDTEEIENETKEKERKIALRTTERQVLADMDERQKAQYEKDKLDRNDILSANKLKGITEPKEPDFEEKGLLEDLAKLKALQEELRGEDDQELEEYKKELMKELEKTPSELEAMTHFATKLQNREETVLQVVPTDEDDVSKSESASISVEIEEAEKKYEEVYVGAIPGIGPRVPEELVKEVERYMKEMAKLQHGKVMPRNIRHYDCPPLEVIDHLEKEIKVLDNK